MLTFSLVKIPQITLKMNKLIGKLLIQNSLDNISIQLNLISQLNSIEFTVYLYKRNAKY